MVATMALVTRIYTVCAWCPPDKRRAEEVFALAKGYTASHGICEACTEKFLQELEDGNVSRSLQDPEDVR